MVIMFTEKEALNDDQQKAKAQMRRAVKHYCDKAKVRLEFDE